jgi:uncharacterized membrane protein SpoIIM required for sporulation
MSEQSLRSHRFRREREAEWRRLEEILDRAERRSAASLRDDDILAAPLLYRSTLSALSVARSTSLDRSLIEYLESLGARAYFFVYGARTNARERIVSFFARDWPRAVRALGRETLVTAMLTLVGALAAAGMTLSDPDWYFSLIPREMAQGRDPTASTESLRGTLYGADGRTGLSVFAAFLFTHNAQVALLAFALGFAFGIPTIALLIYNGASLGAFVALFASRGLGMEAGGWLLIHGVTELFAIVLAGAAGLHVGMAMAFPGDRTRLDALTAAGRTASTVMAGVVVMLFIAGLLEGFGRQLITQDGARYLVAAVTAVGWGLYFYAPKGDHA